MKTPVPSQVANLAARLGVSADELAKKIPADTLRRTQYPVLEQVGEDGSRVFLHDRQIRDDARIALVPCPAPRRKFDRNTPATPVSTGVETT